MGNKCLGQAVRPNDPQRKSDTDTRVDPKTSPVPRLEGNPPAVRRAFLFYGKKARRASVFTRTVVRVRAATVKERFSTLIPSRSSISKAEPLKTPPSRSGLGSNQEGLTFTDIRGHYRTSAAFHGH